MADLADAMSTYWQAARYHDWVGESVANKLSSLRQWTNSGQPALISFRNITGEYHTIVVDEIGQMGRVAIRDPHGLEFWMRTSDFTNKVLRKSFDAVSLH
jgi:hypothetical protein